MNTHKIWTVTVGDWSQKFLNNPSWASIELALIDDPKLQSDIKLGKVAVHFECEEIIVNPPVEGHLIAGGAKKSYLDLVDINSKAPGIDSDAFFY
jgi:hypothetical protein